MTEAEWRAQPGPWAHLTKEQTDELIDTCVRAEREACAKIADDVQGYDTDNWCAETAKVIGEAIRNRKQK